jgi:hypothetical protein
MELRLTDDDGFAVKTEVSRELLADAGALGSAIQLLLLPLFDQRP